MNIFILNESFQLQHIIDSFYSFIWTDRYDEAGEFELSVASTTANLSMLKRGYYLQIIESDHLMIIESISLDTDSDGDNTLKITGRSAESLLDRRIVWTQITFAAGITIQSAIKTLITDAFLTTGDRYVSGFIFEENSDLATTPVLVDDASLGYGAQYLGDNIYNVVHDLCQENGLGFQITLNDSNQLVMKLTNGVDHSYDNTGSNPYVVFSPKFENLLSSNYLESQTNYKTIALVGGEGEGTARVFASTTSTLTGLNRKEVFVDASDISSSSTDANGNTITIDSASYKQLLIQKGIDSLTDYTESTSFEGEADIYGSFTYGKDFTLGDIIQLEDAYGHSDKCRVNELVVSYDTSDGYKVYPTFITITEDEE